MLIMSSASLIMLVCMVTLAQGQLDPPEENFEAVQLPRCCPSGEALTGDNRCTPYHTSVFTPSVFEGNRTMKLMNIQNTRKTEMPCQGETEGPNGSLVTASLHNDEASLYQMDDLFLLVWYPPTKPTIEEHLEFCIGVDADGDVNGEPHYVAQFCEVAETTQAQLELTCENATCVRKCCPLGDVLLNDCFPRNDGQIWTPNFYSKSDPTQKTDPPQDLFYVHGIPQCDDGNILIYKEHEHLLLDTGEVSLSGIQTPIPHTQYCLESDMSVSGEEESSMALVCQEEVESKEDCQWKFRVLDLVLMVISCIFLALTSFVYMSIPQLRNAIIGRCLISFVSALFGAFVGIMVVRYHSENFSSSMCFLSALVCYTNIMGTFFWLNIICYHIWSDLRSRQCEQNKRKLFLKYILYGWGLPIALTLVVVIVDSTAAQSPLKPNLSLPLCWFQGYASRWFYQYGIMMVTVSINIIFFISSVLTLIKNTSHDNQQVKNRLSMFLKLFILMGISWVTEIISWHLTAKCSFWSVALDFITGLQGVFVFVVAVVLRKDIKILHCDWPKMITNREDDPDCNGDMDYELEHTVT